MDQLKQLAATLSVCIDLVVVKKDDDGTIETLHTSGRGRARVASR